MTLNLGPKGFPDNHRRAQAYTIELDGPFGNVEHGPKMVSFHAFEGLSKKLSWIYVGMSQILNSS